MRIVVVLVCLLVASCAVKVRNLVIEPLQPAAGDSFTVQTAVKAHLIDGSTVIFDNGISVLDDKIIGEGSVYDLRLQRQREVTELPLTQVAAMESFQTPLHSGATAAASTGATVGGGIGAIGLLKMVFGSCPTTYSLVGNEPVLEAESFSYSIAPGFEARDVDRLGIPHDTRDIFPLEMRNEALETHYINQVEVLAVAHEPDEAVYTDQHGRPLVVRRPKPPLAALDNTGAEVIAQVTAADGNAWRASDSRLQRVSTADYHDSVVLTFAAPADERGVLVLRLRNSLLNTVLLYDVMLAGQGFRALDWMGKDLTQLFDRWELASWYRKTMGLRVSVLQGSRWKEVATFDDTGPIAWKDVAVSLPRSRSDSITVKLSFVSDNWRIDQAALASLVGAAEFVKVPTHGIYDAFNTRHILAERDLADSDKRYVITQPGDFLRFEFDASTLATDRLHTFFLAARGYYIEWMRREWLQETTDDPFEPNDAAVLDALNRWQSQRETMRAQFDATRINVR